MQLTLPEDIIFSNYAYRKIPSILKRYGKKPLIVTGRNSFFKNFWGREILELLKIEKIKFTLYSGIESEPDFNFVEQGLKLAKRKKCDIVLGIGGGSVLDVAKAIAGLFNDDYGSIAEYLYGKEIKNLGLPFIAVPTTSGSGSEVTMNSVLKDSENCIKASIRDKRLMAKVAIVDPVLTLTLPKKQTLYSSLDSLTHALESYVSKASLPLTKTLSIKAVELIYYSLPDCLNKPRNLRLRERLSFASLIAGISFSNAGLGLAHALSHPIGALFNLRHGLVNAILIPQVVRFNYSTCAGQYLKLLSYLKCDKGSDKKLYDILMDFNKKLKLTLKFSQLGIILDKVTIKKIIDRLKYSGSLKYNPKTINKNELRGFLKRIW